MSEYDSYVSPLSKRYASREMQYLFSQEKKFRTWRKLWIALAETEKELGLNITDEQIAELKAHQDEINYKDAEERERVVRHDVMKPCICLWPSVPEGEGHHPPWRDILLCRRQYRYHHYEGGP